MKKDEKLFRVLIAVCLFMAAVVVIYCLSAGCGMCAKPPPGEQSPSQSDTTDPAQPVSDTVRVTFPEGKNILQYGALLEENGVCKAQDFYDAMNNTDFSADFPFLPAFDELADRPYKLEGYLFPDTYDFFVGEAPESVIKRFLNNFKRRVTEEMIGATAQTGSFYDQELNLDDVIVMASIVEKEVSAAPGEMNGVAAVFYNRMKHPGGTVDGSATGGFFQSDATKYYPYTIYTAPDDFVSEYNTFKVKGLPKGPICCPSLSAIKASIYPDHEVDSFFFYTDKNGKVYYAVTYKKHIENYEYCKENGLEPTW